MRRYILEVYLGRFLKRTLFILVFSCPLIVLGQKSDPCSTEMSLTDKQWLSCLCHVLDSEFARESSPILKSQFGLSEKQIRAVEELMKDYNQFERAYEEVTHEEAIGKRKSKLMAYLFDDQMRLDKSKYKGTAPEVYNILDKTLKQTHVVRAFLSDRDLDFREWFSEEGVIDAHIRWMMEGGKYYGTSNEEFEKMITDIESGDVFKQFKREKEGQLGSPGKTKDYFSKWRSLIEKRHLFLETGMWNFNLTKSSDLKQYKKDHESLRNKALKEAVAVASEIWLLESSFGKK